MWLYLPSLVWAAVGVLAAGSWEDAPFPPRYWPPWSVVEQSGLSEREWDAVPETVRHFVEWEMSGATFDADCERNYETARERTVVTVYFWPHEQLRLPCLVCRRADAINGLVKQWRVLQGSDMLVNASASVETEARNAKMPRLYSYAKPLYAPRAKFYQRDGALVIEQPSVHVQGAYNCFDASTASNVDLVYMAIPMVPLTKLPENRLIEDACDGNFDKLGLLADSEWRRNFMPALVASAADGPYGKTKPDRETVERMRVRVGEAKYGAANPEYVDALNLDAVFAWSEWAACSACAPYVGRRVREGHCYLRKYDAGKKVRVMDSSSENYGWLTQLNNVFNLAPFKEVGVRVHSGLVYTMLSAPTPPSSSPFHLCHDNADYQHLVISVLQDLADEGVCFVHVDSDKKGGWAIGRYYFDMRNCSATC